MTDAEPFRFSAEYIVASQASERAADERSKGVKLELRAVRDGKEVAGLAVVLTGNETGDRALAVGLARTMVHAVRHPELFDVNLG